MASQSQAEKFFYKHAGYAQRPGESKETARRRGARALAQAEAEAERRGWTYEWSYDEDADISFLDEKGLADLEAGRTELLQVLLRDQNGNVLESLGGVHVRAHRGVQDPYGRVVEAELALEALSRMLSNPLRALFG